MHDTDTERALLGSMMLADVDPYVTADDFEAESHRAIYSAIASLRADGQPVDVITVAHKLGNELDTVGGKMLLLDIQQAVPSSAGAERYAEIVRDNARRRRVHAHATLAAAYAESGDPGMEDEVEAVADALHVSDSKPSSIGSLLDTRYSTLDRKRPYVWMSQFPGIHLHFGDFAIIAGRPGMGKSALAQQLGEEWASRGLRTRIYSLEMSDSDYTDRLIMRHTPFTTDDLDDGLTDAQAAFVRDATAEARSWSLDVIDKPAIGVEGIARDIRRAARKGTRVVIIDYLQLLVKKSSGESRYEAVTEASRRLKVLAREANVLLIALSQLNRGSAKEDGSLRPPSVSDLRESGALEQDADDILLIHHYADNDEAIREQLKKRDFILEHDGKQLVCHVDFAKLRRGVTGKRFCWFSGSDQWFAPIDRIDKEAS